MKNKKFTVRFTTVVLATVEASSSAKAIQQAKEAYRQALISAPSPVTFDCMYVKDGLPVIAAEEPCK